MSKLRCSFSTVKNIQGMGVYGILTHHQPSCSEYYFHMCSIWRLSIDTCIDVVGWTKGFFM
jgi:hypothetical protein